MHLYQLQTYRGKQTLPRAEAPALDMLRRPDIRWCAKEICEQKQSAVFQASTDIAGSLFDALRIYDMIHNIPHIHDVKALPRLIISIANILNLKLALELLSESVHTHVGYVDPVNNGSPILIPSHKEASPAANIKHVLAL